MKVEVWKIGATTEPVCDSGLAPECTERVEIPMWVMLMAGPSFTDGTSTSLPKYHQCERSIGAPASVMTSGVTGRHMTVFRRHYSS